MGFNHAFKHAFRGRKWAFPCPRSVLDLNIVGRLDQIYRRIPRFARGGAHGFRQIRRIVLVIGAASRVGPKPWKSLEKITRFAGKPVNVPLLREVLIVPEREGDDPR